MSTKSRPANGRHGRVGRPTPPAWGDADEELPGADAIQTLARTAPASAQDAARQSEARRRLEQYLESKRLQEHLQEVYYEDDR